MARLAPRMETMVEQGGYPEIPFKPHEVEREKRLKALGRKFQELMDEQGNDTALKGGTALRFKLGLPRPSTDLDFEGNESIRVRKTVKKAVALAFPDGGYKVGWNWRALIGTVAIHDTTRRDSPATTQIDYRRMGTYPDMPPKVPMHETRRTDGIAIYDDAGLAHRKLGTIIGPGRTRQRARDIYDAGWLVNVKPDLINPTDRKLLKEWARSLTREHTAELKTRLEDDGVTRRVNADTVISMLKSGIERLNTEPDRDNTRSDGHPGTDSPAGPQLTTGHRMALLREDQRRGRDTVAQARPRNRRVHDHRPRSRGRPDCVQVGNA